MINVTFNKNLGNTSGRASSRGGRDSGASQHFSRSPGGGNNFLLGMLVSRIGARFGIPGIIVAALALFFINGGTSLLSGTDQQQQFQPGTQSAGSGVHTLEHCQTYEDANRYDDCRIQATAVALDNFWHDALPSERNIQYTQPEMVIGGGVMRTGCGSADISQTGPFYCPADETTYFATPFFQQLKHMGGSDGEFSQMYVVAHEFGHHIQQLEGTLSLSDYANPGQDSNAVKMELQADCYAGLWARQADKGVNAMLDPVTQEQVQQAVISAKAIGDDTIQQTSGGIVNPEVWTHGSSEQRMNAFLRGYQGGTMASCHQDFRR